MADLKEARVPDIGGYDDVPVIEVLVAVGDTVAKDQGLVTLESDKATMEVPSPSAGVLREWKIKLGDTVSEGQVIATKPEQGGELKKGTKVALTVSKGRKPITVPSVVGQGSQAAAKQLTALGLSVDATAQANSDTVAKGDVISQSPSDGTLFSGDKVTLVISKGPVLVDVPNVVGQQVDQARTALEGIGFTVEVRKALGGFFGTVRLQDPAGGTAPKGSTITLTIV